MLCKKSEATVLILFNFSICTAVIFSIYLQDFFMYVIPQQLERLFNIFYFFMHYFFFWGGEGYNKRGIDSFQP